MSYEKKAYSGDYQFLQFRSISRLILNPHRCSLKHTMPYDVRNAGPGYGYAQTC
jgi:hypothetical protein